MSKLGFLLILVCMAVVPAQENYAQWSYARTITVNTTSTGANVPVSQTKFPLLVRLTSANFDFTKAASNGSDIRFTKSNGTTRLKHHIERWDAVSQVAEVWVLADTLLGNGNTAFKMFFGRSGVTDSSNAAAVFDTANQFQAVFHLNEPANDTVRDVTVNGFKGIPTNVGGSNPADFSGIIGHAKNFLGSNSNNNGGSYQIVTSTGGSTFTNNALNFKNDSSTYLGQDAYTISAWVYVDAFPDGTNNRKAIVAKSDGVSGQQYHLRLLEPAVDQTNPLNDSNRIEFNDKEPYIYKSGVNNLATGTWYHVAGERTGPRGDTTSLKVYVNGFSPASGSSNSIGSTVQSNYGVFIGSYSNDSGFFNGKIAEVEFSNIARDSNWLKLDYQTQQPNANCTVTGALQQQFPSNLTYSANPAIYAKGVRIASNVPAYVGIATHFSVSPSLPPGLSLDTSTGILTGTPAGILSSTNYTITATSPAGITAAILNITILTPPSGLSYSVNPCIYGVNVAVSNNSPSVTGDVTYYSMSPVLPAGLTLNTTTGVLSGTPTTASVATNYIVTAGNSASSTVDTVNITVLGPPSGLSYAANPAVYGVGVVVAGNAPSVTGTVTTYSVTPPLPTGLILNAGTGVISGTPGVVTPASNYTVTASNIAGGTPVSLSITTILVPSNLSYVRNSPEYAATVAIHPDTPSVTGIIAHYSVSPALPTGLNLDTLSGVMSGTPTVQTPTTSFVITAGNAVGVVRDTLKITVTTAPPSNLHYSSNAAVYGVGVGIANNTATVTGTATHFTVLPPLPAGLVLDSAAGLISGTPTVASAAANYVVTVSNLAGSAVDTLNFTVLAAPSSFAYSTNPAVYGVNVAIVNNAPVVTGAVTGYSASPNLPTGLALNATTGVVSGTPTGVQTAANYTIKAFNGPAFTSVLLSIAVLSPPSGLTYPTLADTVTLGVGVSTGSNSPSVTGTVTHYSASALPPGMLLDSNTGVLSGTPATASVFTAYTVTAANVAGSSSRTLVMRILASPTNLSYSVNPVVYPVNAVIVNDIPVVTGTVTGYSVSPPLPTGLILNNATGVISGTPTAVQTTTNYVITASNIAGSTSFTLNLSVLVPPSAFSYSVNSAIYGVNLPIAGNSPTVTGTNLRFSVVPALPAGLALDTVSGMITGTPAVASTVSGYTVTAGNAAGTASVLLNISVLNPINTFAYPRKMLLLGKTIAMIPDTPAVTGASPFSPVTYSVNPALPAGLSLDTSTGIVSGTPVNALAPAVYVMTATSRIAQFSRMDTLQITVLNPPGGFSYSANTAAYGVNIAIVNNVPTDTGTNLRYSVVPALPAGLVLDTLTGIISGIPTTALLASNFKVTAANIAGSTTDTLNIRVDAAPANLSYFDDGATYVLGVKASANTPSITGLDLHYSVSPPLPPGLVLDSLSGIVSGTPTGNQSFGTDYTITARNIAGSTQSLVYFTVVGAPSNLSYLDEAPTYALGIVISPPDVPTIQGIVTFWTVSPALPPGVYIDGSTGYILGTPTAASANANYTITGTNPGGSTSVVVFLGTQ